MRVTTKDQVTIPREIKESLRKFSKLRGIASAKMSTDEIIQLTRES